MTVAAKPASTMDAYDNLERDSQNSLWLDWFREENLTIALLRWSLTQSMHFSIWCFVGNPLVLFESLDLVKEETK